MKNIPIRQINIAQQKTALTGKFSIRAIKDLFIGSEMTQELHRHDFYYILALEKGIGSHEIDFKSYSVEDKTVFFLRPGQVHKLSLKAGSSGYLIAFNTNFYFPLEKVSTQLLRKTSNINHRQFDANQYKKIAIVLKYMYQEFTDQHEDYLEVIKANLGIFFIELARQNVNSKKYLDSNNSYAQERLDDFLALLETHIASYKQVSQYADMLHLSAYQLNAITKTTLNKTCSALINDYIILEAKRYLLATTNQINQIALQLGYEDASYFIRFFKKHTGYSPEAFRKNYK